MANEQLIDPLALEQSLAQSPILPPQVQRDDSGTVPNVQPVAQPLPPITRSSPGSDAQRVPQPGYFGGNLVNLIGQLVKPTAQVHSGQLGTMDTLRPPSRMHAFEQFLGNFLSAFAQGMGAQGTGPGAGGRGFAAAQQAPYERAVQQYQLQQQKAAQDAQIQHERALTEQLQSQSNTVEMQDSNGNTYRLPAKLAAQILAAKERATGTVKAAETRREGQIGTAIITGEDRIKAAQIAAGSKSATGKVNPIVAAQVGLPPNPDKYKGGADDPQYKQDAAAWGKAAEVIANRMAAAQGMARGQAYGMWRPVQVIDADTGEAKWEFAGTAVASGNAPLGGGATAMSKQAQFGEMKFASSRLRDSITKLDRNFTPAQIAKLSFALSSNDPSVVENLKTTLLGTQQLTSAQQDFVIWSTQMNERLLSLRNIAGMGQGAEDLRNAIRATLPGVKSGSKDMALKQLDAVDNQINLLQLGIPKVKGHLGAPTGTKGKVLVEGKDF